MLPRNRTPGQLTPVWEEKASCSQLFPITGIPRERCVSIFVIHFRVFPVILFILFFLRKDLLQSLANRGGNWSGVSRESWVHRTLGIPRISESKEAEHRPLWKSPIGCTLAPSWLVEESGRSQSGLVTSGWTTGQQAWERHALHSACSPSSTGCLVFPQGWLAMLTLVCLLK